MHVQLDYLLVVVGVPRGEVEQEALVDYGACGGVEKAVVGCAGVDLVGGEKLGGGRGRDGRVGRGRDGRGRGEKVEGSVGVGATDPDYLDRGTGTLTALGVPEARANMVSWGLDAKGYRDSWASSLSIGEINCGYRNTDDTI